jgi:hypothetical protein
MRASLDIAGWRSAVALGVALVLAAACGERGGGTARADAGPARPDAVAARPDERTFTTRNGIVSVRYRPPFVASSLDDSTMQIVGSASNVTVGAVMRPLEEDARFIAGLFLPAQRERLRRAGATIGSASEADATCLGKYEGFSTREMVELGGERAMLEGCFFVRDHVAVIVVTMIPDAARETDQAAVGAILDTLELHALARPRWDEKLQTSATADGLLVAHHPSFYVASSPTSNTLVLRGPDRGTITASARPVSPGEAEAAEKGWWRSVATPSQGLVYAEKVHESGTCFGHDGTRARGVLSAASKPAFEVDSCFAVVGGRAFASSIEFPIGAADVEADARRVVARIEIAGAASTSP